jgi:hypothetical protein
MPPEQFYLQAADTEVEDTALLGHLKLQDDNGQLIQVSSVTPFFNLPYPTTILSEIAELTSSRNPMSGNSI